MKKGHIFFISGVAGAGKGTVIKGLLDLEIENLELALSCKTRKAREGEVIGRDYLHFSETTFKKAILNGEFLEYNFVHNQHYYGTRYVDVIDNGIEKGKNIIKEMDILILPYVLENLKEIRSNFTYIFLNIPIEKIKERMISRGDDVTGEDYKNRIDSAKKEQKLLHLCDYVIDATKSKEEVLEEVLSIIKNKKI